MISTTLREKMIKHRNALHQIPEIGFDLVLTHAYIKSILISLGYEIHVLAKTGIVVVKEGKIKKAIAFRSDMDALPVEEKTTHPYKSRHQKNMHACGHDGHMAMLLGLAEHLYHMKELNQSVVLIFQPAEEGPGGAKVMIEEGLFERFHIDKIFGIHLYPDLEEGQYGLVDGPMMARNGEFDVTIKGMSAHAAKPHQGTDALVASAHFITMVQSIISRMMDPLTSNVLTLGKISGGEARNIIAQEVNLCGTMRAFDDALYAEIKQKLKHMAQGVELAFNVSVDVNIMDYYPAVINNHALFCDVLSFLNKAQYQMIKPMMLSEDFSFYQQKVPGLFIMLGTQNKALGFVNALHSCYFDFDSNVLIKGLEFYDLILKTYQIYK